MCFGIPMRITAVDGFTAHCEAKGVRRAVSLFMMQDAMPGVGEFIVVHRGCAMQTISAQDAQSAWDLYEQMLAAED